MENESEADSDLALTLKLEAYGDASSTESSSNELCIVSDTEEAGDKQACSRKRRRSQGGGDDDDVRQKRVRDDDDEDDDGDDEGAEDSECEREMPDVVHAMEGEIQRQLDAKAKQSNLTVDNVKDILKDIITNEDVLEMVRLTMKQQERNFYFSKVFNFRPKLTRAKTRELMKTCPSMVWPITPSKCTSTSKCKVLIEQELSEDSSDEEYKPNEEDDDDQEEKESEGKRRESPKGKEKSAEQQCDSDDAEELSDTGDVEDNEQDDSEDDENLDEDFQEGCKSDSHLRSSDRHDTTTASESEAYSKERSDFESSPEKLSNKDRATQTLWTDDSAKKTLQFEPECSLKGNVSISAEENIGQRTRSKFSLSDTPLEAIESAFVPPDITTDMYDSECDDEDWKSFLKGFTEPLRADGNDAPDDDDEADPEYNILADEEEAEDKEELRADPGVQVPRKEVNALMAELFEYIGMLDESPKKSGKTELYQVHQPTNHDSVLLQDIAEHIAGAFGEDIADISRENDQTKTVPSVQAVESVQAVVPPPPPPPEQDSQLLTHEQKLLLDQQMRKHIQLIMQHFLLTYLHPLYHKYSLQCKKYIVALKCRTADNHPSVLYAGNLDDALMLIEQWEKLYSSPEKREEYQKYFEKEMKLSRHHLNYRKYYLGEFTEDFFEAVLNNNVFLYPLLLPVRTFRYDSAETKFFVPSEDWLIAIGLEQFEKYAKRVPSALWKNAPRKRVVSLIKQHLVTAKNPTALEFHVRKCKAKPGNPIHYYFEHGQAPPTSHFVIPFDQLVKPPIKQPIELFPEVWQEYIKSKKELKV